MSVRFFCLICQYHRSYGPCFLDKLVIKIIVHILYVELIYNYVMVDETEYANKGIVYFVFLINSILTLKTGKWTKFFIFIDKNYCVEDA